MKSIRNIILYIWQLPQNLLALMMLLIYKHEKEYYKYKGRKFYHTKEMPSGISLGDYIIMNWEDKEDGMKHEFGHTIQSRMLGWLYLPVVGLISIIRAWYDSIYHTEKYGWTQSQSMKWYYGGFPENWADKLGKVKRKYDED